MPSGLGTGLLPAAVAAGLLAHLLLSVRLARIVGRERTPVFPAALDAAPQSPAPRRRPAIDPRRAALERMGPFELGTALLGARPTPTFEPPISDSQLCNGAALS